MQAEAQAAVAIPHDFVPSTPAELAACLADPMWRLCSGQLYKILVKEDDGDDGMVLPSSPTARSGGSWRGSGTATSS